MKYVKLGRTGLDVSPIALGCMSYGIPERGNHTWVIEETHSRSFIKKALDLGINFFDTANIYSDGTSEEILGRALKDFAKRDEVVDRNQSMQSRSYWTQWAWVIAKSNHD